MKMFRHSRVWIGGLLLLMLLGGCTPIVDTRANPESDAAATVAAAESEAAGPAQGTPAPEQEAVAPGETPAVAEGQEDGPVATVLVPSLNMRSGPGLDYAVVDAAPQDSAYMIVGQAFNCGWLQVEGPSGEAVWISGGAQYVRFSPLCDQIPAVAPPALPDAPIAPTAAPAPTAEPAAAPTAAPTAEPVEEAPAAAPSSGDAPAEDPLPADQGCFLLENFISIELNVTLTAQNWNWNDNFRVEPMGQRVYCLAPGRYTWTVDAPPPWNEINGEFSIKAGDRLIWPIRAE